MPPLQPSSAFSLRGPSLVNWYFAALAQHRQHALLTATSTPKQAQGMFYEANTFNENGYHSHICGTDLDIHIYERFIFLFDLKSIYINQSTSETETQTKSEIS